MLQEPDGRQPTQVSLKSAQQGCQFLSHSWPLQYQQDLYVQRLAVHYHSAKTFCSFLQIKAVLKSRNSMFGSGPAFFGNHSFLNPHACLEAGNSCKFGTIFGSSWVQVLVSSWPVVFIFSILFCSEELTPHCPADLQLRGGSQKGEIPTPTGGRICHPYPTGKPPVI